MIPITHTETRTRDIHHGIVLETFFDESSRNKVAYTNMKFYAVHHNHKSSVVSHSFIFGKTILKTSIAIIIINIIS